MEHDDGHVAARHAVGNATGEYGRGGTVGIL